MDFKVLQDHKSKNRYFFRKLRSIINNERDKLRSKAIIDEINDEYFESVYKGSHFSKKDIIHNKKIFKQFQKQNLLNEIDASHI